MAVFTDVSFDAAAELVGRLGLGPLTALEGCSGGIENSNFFADTAEGRYVLTVFERLTFEQLPFYLQLMRHLAAHGIPVPGPKADADGEILFTLNGKPAAFLSDLCILLGGKVELLQMSSNLLLNQRLDVKRQLLTLKDALKTITQPQVHGEHLVQ